MEKCTGFAQRKNVYINSAGITLFLHLDNEGEFRETVLENICGGNNYHIPRFARLGRPQGGERSEPHITMRSTVRHHNIFNRRFNHWFWHKQNLSGRSSAIVETYRYDSAS